VCISPPVLQTHDFDVQTVRKELARGESAVFVSSNNVYVCVCVCLCVCVFVCVCVLAFVCECACTTLSLRNLEPYWSLRTT
jgi:hypothetical protein